ncbi:acetoacetate--CoA ligase [Bryobacter aggregatus]|uniref:acetoacetate--CoA ligase n=1 Tax=Bryobacter aggregatus TaxID=360054 RepID=UPI00068B43BF|nr:acetoacetate--CoA ligase [Bryobacter aggregatus]
MPTHLSQFLTFTGHTDYWSLYDWSIQSSPEFWSAFSHFADLPAPGEPFNFAELLLRGNEAGTVLLFRSESNEQVEWTRGHLRTAVGSYAHLLRHHGIVAGDRVAALLPNRPETIALMLATASLGAIWSSCSPDFGSQGVIDRLQQMEPKLLFSTGTSCFAGKTHSLSARLDEIRAAIPSLLAIHRIEEIALDPAPPLHFELFPHRHPLFILFSSGTTGLPKCIVHSAGGTLLQIAKEQLLHADIHPGERLFYYTTCGWMMWNWLATGLVSGATLVLYDGSPMYPDPGVLWRLAEQEGIQHFGTSAKYLALLESKGYQPRLQHDLTVLRQVLSTGSPLLPQSALFVDREIKAGVHLASISGGTDIVSCFVLGNPLLPVHGAEIQCAGLGMDVQIWNEKGERVWDEAGELVCCNQFPSMPLGFWNDPAGERYEAAYFKRFPGIWHHGDWAAQSSTTKGFTIYGRSDTTLNPGGIRIGTAEIYRQVETMEAIEESIAVAQDWHGDVRIVLFVKLRAGHSLTQELRDEIRRTLRQKASPHHVPKKILAVTAIPRTVSGKISEAAVRDAIHGRPLANQNALANPESIKEFQACPELLHD